MDLKSHSLCTRAGDEDVPFHVELNTPPGEILTAFVVVCEK